MSTYPGFTLGAAAADVGDGTLGHRSRLLAAGPALACGWGEPARWLAAAHYVSPGHDAWVVGTEPLVVIDFTAPARLAGGGSLVACHGCGVEFGVGQVDHLIAAVQQHASGSHGHDLSRDHILSELQPA